MDGCDVSWWITASVTSSLKRRYSDECAARSRRRGAIAAPWANSRRLILAPAFKQIPSLHHCTQLSIRHTAMQHPKTTIRMDIAKPSRAQSAHDLLEATRDQFRFFNFIVLDVDNADSQ